MRYESSQHFIKVTSLDEDDLARINILFAEFGIFFKRDAIDEAMQQAIDPRFHGIVAQAIFTVMDHAAIELHLADIEDALTGVIHLETGPYFED